MSIVGQLDSNRVAADIYQKEMGYVPFLYKFLPFRFAGLVDQTLTILGVLLTVLLVYNYIGLPRPYELWQRSRAEQSLDRFERLQLKAKSEPLSEKDQKKMEQLIKQLEGSILFSGVAFTRFQKTKDFFESQSQSLQRR
jgi:hypothetical protein